ncbi:TIM23 complex component [Elasticomyces elasticus]|nr:TIM23 complex component [Elasticomyces elasticus]
MSLVKHFTSSTPRNNGDSSLPESDMFEKSCIHHARHSSTHRKVTIQHKRLETASIKHKTNDRMPPTSFTNNSGNVLTWDRFFAVRRRKRYINLAVSIVTAGVTVVVVGPLLAQQDIDTWGAQISGIDPMFVLGISTIAVAAGGWLCGPSLGSAMFGVWAARRGWAKAIQGKEKSFYRRIQKYRADPSSSSPQNPIPDYYGEKVASVKDYRRWLKDQRAFKLKKNKNLF